MKKKVKIAIIGAGTAGLQAMGEVLKVTKSVVIIDEGPLGTTCARVGCMPSKALISVAKDFSRSKVFDTEGIEGGEKLSVDSKKVMKHVRRLRDYYVDSVLKGFKDHKEYFIKGTAKLISKNEIEVNGEIIHAENIILALGSKPVLPDEYKDFSSNLITSNKFFELEKLPETLAVVGLGPLGLELALASAHLGVKVCGFNKGKFIGGLSDPKINEVATDIFNQHLDINITSDAKVEELVQDFELVLLSIGRKSRLPELDLKQIGLKVDGKQMPRIHHRTLHIKGTRIFVAGDATEFKPILHEVADEGHMAAKNALRDKPKDFIRRTPLAITFTNPQIAVVGKSFKTISHLSDIVIGEVSFENQGRATVMMKNEGHLRIYATRKSGKILGAEFVMHEGEHIAHLLALAIQQKMNVHDLLKMPFYHPTLEEGFRTALLSIAKKLKDKDGAGMTTPFS